MFFGGGVELMGVASAGPRFTNLGTSDREKGMVVATRGSRCTELAVIGGAGSVQRFVHALVLIARRYILWAYFTKTRRLQHPVRGTDGQARRVLGQVVYWGGCRR